MVAGAEHEEPQHFAGAAIFVAGPTSEVNSFFFYLVNVFVLDTQ
jgi:hypothetical protein